MSQPDFRSPSFLLDHIRHTMAFYDPRARDEAGGFFQYYKDDGTIYDHSHRHLVSSTRFVFNYAMAAREFDRDDYRELADHGLRYLRDVHRDADSGGYAWTLRDHRAEDRMNHCYGLAFVLLAYASARKAGLETAAWMDETWNLLEQRYWDSAFGLYRDEADAQWHFTAYRGQNANMHMCEAMLAAYEASGEARYLERARTLADNMTRRQAKKANGLVWEHYDENWNVDWKYHLDDPKHLFRPWGFQPGHQTEWAKLLLIIDRHAPADWLLPTAKHLFDEAYTHSWDSEFGGMVYGFAPESLRTTATSAHPVAEGATYWCDDDKYFWVQAESLAAAALLAERSGEKKYWEWYEQLWDYSWRHFVDHRYGAWHRILDRRNRKYGDEKSPAGKTDYHTMGACYEVLNVVRGEKA
jgi:mannose/cellobiose epimerase-like protein (N-acyl-D-glucosamine 2-epimerase family)